MPQRRGTRVNASTSVLIAGGGWRVSRFIVPALLNEGVPAERIVILRRSAGDGAGLLRDIRIVTRLEEVSAFQCDVTINCVSAASLVPVQRALLRQFTHATHLCDTPIFERNEELRQVLAVARARIYSLEDWPSLPNLRFFADRARRSGRPGALSVEHFGIPGHFLSLFRTICRRWLPSGRMLTGSDASVTGTPLPGLVVSWTGPKQFVRAKVALRTSDGLVEDFHEVEDQPHDDGEVLYRVIADGLVRYCLGKTEVSAHTVRSELLATFQPLGDRKNVHELDKFIGLTTMFRSLFQSGRPALYPYLSSARDAITTRRLVQQKASWLW